MIENDSQFLITLQRLGSFLEGLEELQHSLLPKNAALYAVASESVLEDIRRLRHDLLNYCAQVKAAG